ncbi:MAG: DUF3617 domain-containing protein [Pseudomonadota bacterium]
MSLFKTVFAATAAVLMTLTALPASAQSMKPGLWEVTSKMGGNPEMDKAMAQMQQQMASMPPEQRKMMEDMLAKQGVGSMGAGGGGFMAKICISKEMAERNQVPVQQQGDCKTTISDKTATGMKMAFTCTNPPSSGEGQFIFTSDSAYSMKMKVNSQVQGKAQTTTVDGTGKFVAADCGNIKPMAVPKG